MLGELRVRDVDGAVCLKKGRAAIGVWMLGEKVVALLRLSRHLQGNDHSMQVRLLFRLLQGKSLIAVASDHGEVSAANMVKQ